MYTFRRRTRAIIPLIAFVVLFAVITESSKLKIAASVINAADMLRDVAATEVNTMSSIVATSMRQSTEAILRDNDRPKNNANDGNNKNNSEMMAYSDELIDLSSSSTSSGEILRFINDNDAKEIRDSENNSSVDDVEEVEDFKKANLLQHKNNDNNNNKNQADNNNLVFETNTNAHTKQRLLTNENNNDYMESLPLRDQIRLLSKQLNVLMTRRREDYELLEHNLRKSLRITQQPEQQEQQHKVEINYAAADSDSDIRNELTQLRLVELMCQKGDSAK